MGLTHLTHRNLDSAIIIYACTVISIHGPNQALIIFYHTGWSTALTPDLVDDHLTNTYCHDCWRVCWVDVFRKLFWFLMQFIILSFDVINFSHINVENITEFRPLKKKNCDFPIDRNERRISILSKKKRNLCVGCDNFMMAINLFYSNAILLFYPNSAVGKQAVFSLTQRNWSKILW